MLTWCREHTDMNPVSLDNSIHAFIQRYKARWYWRPTTWTASKTAYKIFDRFIRDDNKRKKEAARNGKG